MAATAPVTTVTVPPPAVGGTEVSPARSAAANVVAPTPAAAPVEASTPVFASTDAAKVILAQPPEPTPAPPPAPVSSQAAADAEYDLPPSVRQIQAALSQLLQQLDNQPAEHPNAPAVVLLQNKETALRVALAQAMSGVSGPEQAYLSGVVLNAAV